MQMVGLGGGEQDAIDARAKQRARPGSLAHPEAFQHGRERALEIAHGIGPGIEGGERIDQHDLPVEAGEMALEERPHHHVLVGLEPPPHHGGERARGRRSLAVRRCGHCSGEKVSAGEPARSPGMRKRPGGSRLMA